VPTTFGLPLAGRALGAEGDALPLINLEKRPLAKFS
jgi:hypothetical protein